MLINKPNSRKRQKKKETRETAKRHHHYRGDPGGRRNPQGQAGFDGHRRWMKPRSNGIKPLDLSEAIRFAPGVMVSYGDKSVYTLKLRGSDSKRIALLVDGIPCL